MKNIKLMLLGIAIILVVIVFHMFMEDGLLTDLIAIAGLIMVGVGYISKDGNEKPSE